MDNRINPGIHKSLIVTGCFLWCVSAIGEAFNGQPYSTIGIVISPILLGVGIFYWVRYYRASRGYYPKLRTVWDSVVYLGYGKYTLDSDFGLKHIPEILTFSLLLCMWPPLIGNLASRRSDAFNAVKQYCQTNTDVLSQTGKIKYYGVWIGISNSKQEGKTDVSFHIVGTKGNFSAKSVVAEMNGILTVEKLELQ